MCERADIIGFTSSGSFFTLAFLIKKAGLDPKQALKKYSTFIDIIPTDRATFNSAYNSSFADIEDAFQYYTALNEEALDLFVTQNIKDYKFALHKLPVVTSEAFLKIFYEKR